jgi:hypothetical protein
VENARSGVHEFSLAKTLKDTEELYERLLAGRSGVETTGAERRADR